MAYGKDIDDMDDAPDEEMDEMEVEDDPDAIVEITFVGYGSSSLPFFEPLFGR